MQWKNKYGWKYHTTQVEVRALSMLVSLFYEGVSLCHTHWFESQAHDSTAPGSGNLLNIFGPIDIIMYYFSFSCVESG